jgi:hypothetical protein
MDRRNLLKGAAVTSVGLFAERARAADAASPNEVGAALQRFRESIPSNFNRDYVEHVLVPFFLTSVYAGETPLLPVIETEFSKEKGFSCRIPRPDL